MALVTGLPNFYNAANLTAADLNNAFKAILEVIGGTYYDELSGSYVQAGGGLAANNLSASAGFRVGQVAEPYGVSLPIPVSTGTAEGGILGPVTYDCSLTRLSVLSRTAANSAWDNYVTGGTYRVLLNGSAIGTYGYDLPGMAVGGLASSNLDIPLRLGDTLQFDLTNTTTSNSTRLFYISTLVTALHAR